MPRYEVPKFMGYGDAIQATQGMSSAFKDLSNTSQNFLNYSENQKQNAFDNQYKTDSFGLEKDKFTETKNQNKIANDNADRTFNYDVTRDGVKDGQWQKDYNLRFDGQTFDQNYKNKVFDHTVSQDGISNFFKQQQLNKPDYATFNGVDAQGNPTLNMINKNNGSVINTGQQVYNEAKKLAPEQSLYYLDRANEMKQKNNDALQKSLLTHPAYSKLGEEDKIRAYDYVIQNGKLPEFNYDSGVPFVPYTGGYSLKMSEAVKQESGKVPKKDGSNIDLYKD